MIIRNGTKKTFDPTALAMYQVRGPRANAVKIEEVPLAVIKTHFWYLFLRKEIFLQVAAALNSGDSFVVVAPKATYVWHGLGSFDFQEDAATAVAKHVGQTSSSQEVTEGTEPAHFWSAIGGKGAYCTSESLKKTKRTEQEAYRLRLYKISFTGGKGNPTV